jgi:hypothetical protein
MILTSEARCPSRRAAGIRRSVGGASGGVPPVISGKRHNGLGMPHGGDQNPVNSFASRATGGRSLCLGRHPGWLSESASTITVVNVFCRAPSSGTRASSQGSPSQHRGPDRETAQAHHREGGTTLGQSCTILAAGSRRRGSVAPQAAGPTAPTASVAPTQVQPESRARRGLESIRFGGVSAFDKAGLSVGNGKCADMSVVSRLPPALVLVRRAIKRGVREPIGPKAGMRT